MSCGVQEETLVESAKRGREAEPKQRKPNKNILLVDGEQKKRNLQSPTATDALRQSTAEPDQRISEKSRLTPDPISVAGEEPKVCLDQPPWHSSEDDEEWPEHSSGEPPIREAAAETRISSAVRIHGHVLELACRVRQNAMRALLDSGSTGNFVSTQFVAAVGLSVQPDPEWEEVTLADGSTLKTEGRVQFTMKCGGYKGKILARVFPHLHKEVILGVPWLIKANPAIDWTQRRVTVCHRGCDVVLPLIQKRDAKDTNAEVHLCTAKQMERQVQRGQALFLAMVRPAQEEMETEDRKPGETDEQKMHHKEMPEEIKAVLNEFKDVFPCDLPPGLPPVRQGHQFRIELEDDTPPVHRPIYKLSPLELDEAKKQIQYMLDKGFIRPSDSPYGSPVLFAPKADGGLRFCIDYRWLNKKTIKNRYPLPLPEEMFDRLGGAKVFSKIDLRSGYWQMPVRQEDIPKTAFKTRWGLYECLVVPFGVTNAPAQFMNLMNDLLHDFLDEFILVFLDDILIYSRSEEEHAEHLRKVFTRLRKHRLFAKATKCQVAVKTIDFLGQHITPGGMSPQDQKLKAVREWETPTDVRGVRSFLGFTNYYRRFLRHYAELAHPLTDLTKKDVGFQWGPLQRKAFMDLKSTLCNAPILVFPDPLLPYTVVTDASQHAVGGVIMQDQGEGLRPIAFHSKTLKASEMKYSAYERELAAIAYCFMVWRHYIEGCPGGVTVLTDHQTLRSLMDQPVLTRVQTRWLRLGLFQSIVPKIQYQPGKANIVADALSRSRRGPVEETKSVDEPELLTLSASEVVPAAEVQKWREALDEDPSLRATVQQLRGGQEIWRSFQMTSQGLLFTQKDDQRKLVVPTSLRQRILRECHDIPSVGHVGIRRTVELLDRMYHWKGMRADATSYVRTCPVCQMVKSDNRKVAGPLQPIPPPERKWSQVTTDLVTDLPDSEGYTAVAVFVDRLTKMVHFAPCTKEVTASDYARLFVDTVFRHHGLPDVIISDRDPRFTSKFWTTLFELLGTDLRFSTAFHPQTDGQSEVTIRTLENFLRPYVERNPHTWVKQLALAEFAANNTVNASTGYTPFFLEAGQDPTVPMSLLGPQVQTKNQAVNDMVDRMKEALESAHENIKSAQMRMKRAVDKKRREETFAEGDEVVITTKHLRNLDLHLPVKLRRRWVGPFAVCKVVSPVAYRLSLPQGWQIHPTFHVSKLKRYLRSDEFVREVEPPPPDLVEGTLEYEVEGILRDKGKGARRRYLVLWKGYPLSEATWEPEEHLSNAQPILEDYLRRVSVLQARTRTRGTRGA